MENMEEHGALGKTGSKAWGAARCCGSCHPVFCSPAATPDTVHRIRYI